MFSCVQFHGTASLDDIDGKDWGSRLSLLHSISLLSSAFSISHSLISNCRVVYPLLPFISFFKSLSEMWALFFKIHIVFIIWIICTYFK